MPQVLERCTRTSAWQVRKLGTPRTVYCGSPVRQLILAARQYREADSWAIGVLSSLVIDEFIDGLP